MFLITGLVVVALGLAGRMIPMLGSALIGIMQAQLSRILTEFFAGVKPIGTTAAVAGVVLILVCPILLRKRLKNSTGSMHPR
jgi:hypothetical protein